MSGGARALAVLTVAALLALPSGAIAGTAEVTSSGPVFTAAAGEDNFVSVTYTTFYRILDLNNPVTAGPGCLSISANEVGCNSNAPAITLNLGDVSDFGQVIGKACKCFGGPGSDALRGSVGADRLDGGRDNDNLEGGTGPDTLIGGAGDDTVTYESPVPPDPARTVGVDVTLDNVANDGSFEDDAGGVRDNVRSDVENVDGTHFDDRLTGFATATGMQSVLRGADGNDTLRGGKGAPQVEIGGTGADTMLRDPSDPDVLASYADHAGGVTASADGVAHSGNADDGNADRIGANVDSLIGSPSADRLTGNADANVLDGADGDDVLDGRAGADSLLGGNGTDTADYSRRTRDVTATAGGTGGDATDGTGDGLVVENITGGRGNDTLAGDGGPNVLDGDRGNDTLTGGDAGDRLLGRAGADTLDGGLGADDLDGGPDTDQAVYSTRTVAVTASLDGQPNDGNADDGPTGARDNVQTTVEDLVGGGGDDLLVGSAVGNVFHGGAGNDRLRGLGGNDYLYGDGGDDTLTGGPHADFLYGDSGIDTADYSDHTAAQGVTVNLDGVDDDGAQDVDCITYLCPAPAQDDALVENITGGAGDDTLTGDGLDNVLVGARGADSLAGLDGDDDLEARDNIADLQLDCGDGTDSVRFDATLDPAPLDCELFPR